MNYTQPNYYVSIAAGMLLALCATRVHAQTGINTQDPDDHAALDVSSNEKGVLIPRLTNAQANTLEDRPPEDGMLIYNTDQACIQVFVNGNFECLTVSSRIDLSEDQWVDDPGNSLVKLGAKSDDSPRSAGSDVVVTDGGLVGVGTAAPTEALDVAGNVEFSGTLMPDGEVGTNEQVLTSQGSGASPKWVTVKEVTGTLIRSIYVEGDKNDTLWVQQGRSKPIPGMEATITVPPGETRVLNFIITGCAVRRDAAYNQGARGAFELYQSVDSGLSTLQSAAHAASVHGEDERNVPLPVLFVKSLEVSGADDADGTTYTYKVHYASLTNDIQVVNIKPSDYGDYEGADSSDDEAMLPKMIIDVYKK